MSNVRLDSWEVAVDSLSRTLNPTRVDKVVPSAVPFNIASTLPKRGNNLDYLATVLKEAMREDPLLSNTRIIRSTDRLVVALPGDINLDGRVDLTDALLALQSEAGMDSAEPVHNETEISGDNRVGREEALFAVQAASGSR